MSDGRDLSEIYTRGEQRHHQKPQKSTHNVNVGANATRCPQAGQFALVIKNSARPKKGTRSCHGMELDLDVTTLISFAVSTGPRFMKTSSGLLAAAILFSVVGFLHAGNFISQVVQAGSTFDIQVPGGHILVIRNFTQEGTFNNITVRGQVTATDKNGLSATMMTATIADTDPTALLEPVNEVVIAGPSTVTVTGGDTSCFITYRKAEE